ncbi:MAG TPA: hypothetical protein VN806_12995 [Caulobacteraceae bacterium]|nr:hypothetical protein [Caulobacteraceae bacterium]
MTARQRITKLEGRAASREVVPLRVIPMLFGETDEAAIARFENPGAAPAALIVLIKRFSPEARP